LQFFGYLFAVLGGYILNLWLWCQSIDRNKIASKGNKQPVEQGQQKKKEKEAIESGTYVYKTWP